MVILDSDILIGILRDNKEASDFLEKLESRGETLTTTVINAFELFEGAMNHSKPKESVLKVEMLLKSIGNYSFTPPISYIAAQISSELGRKGESIDFQDISIAATAILNEEILVTRNVKHFSKIKNLKTEKW